MPAYKYHKLTKQQLSIVREIKNSKFFDEQWYKSHYTDIIASKLHPIHHYLFHGDAEGRDPGPHFNTNHYRQHTDIDANTNSLYHYLNHLQNKPYVVDSELHTLDLQLSLLKQSPFFNAKFYLNTYPDIKAASIDPALHYLQNGWKEGRNPSKSFDTGYYLAKYPDVAKAKINPLIHYLTHGMNEGRKIRATIYHQNLNDLPADLKDSYLLVRKSNKFDPEFYLSKYPDIQTAGMDPLFHYLKFGANENRDPSAEFNSRFYKAQMTADEIKAYNPLVHYIKIGSNKGLKINALSQLIPPALASGHFFDSNTLPNPSGSIAIMIHMFYPELAQVMVRYLENIPYPFDLLISTDSEDKASTIKSNFNNISNLDSLIIKVVPNRGRDIAPLVISFGAELLNYDFALHLHSKKSPYGSALEGWLEYNLHNLLHSPVYISHLLDELNNPSLNLGALMPAPFPAVVEHMHWENMLDYGKDILKRIDIHPSILNSFELQFPAGSMFWFRPRALKPLLCGKLTLEDFEPEDGQMNATLAHVIERLFLYVVAHEGYEFKTVRPAIDSESFAPLLLSYNSSKTYEILPQQAPLVSIIIPVYNEWSYTSDCINSILAFTDQNQTPYEIILADDCSTDETINAAKTFKNLIVSRPKENLGFSGNCNFAALKAKGEFLIFLNNDTQVQPNWLSHLTNIYKRYPNALITGSKLLYPDNSLQEAGGIVWNNAGGANYGRNDDTPSKPEYTYVKPCDYISGAALMVKHSFWLKVGGFDKLFEPAYYEDTDLCMQARDNGGEVYLQPASQVVHFEGKSHGTDTNTGIKAYQVTNKQNFYAKWKDTLTIKHTTGEHILNARERSMDKTIIAVMDYLLPEYDRHAGARHTFNYIELLLDKGFVVKYLACKVENLRQLNFARELEQMGVETFYPNALDVEFDWNNWLIGCKDYVDAVIFNRPHVAKPHIMTCKTNQIPALYFIHDVHALREYRQAINEGDIELAELIKDNEAVEAELIGSMDYAFTPSEYERQYLQEKYHLNNVGVIPLYLSKDDADIPSHVTQPKTNDITFVGGMKHKPNQEAVKWLIKSVLPNIENKNLKINLIGPNPTDEIYQLSREDNRIVVHGAVSDAQLESIYLNSRIIAIPLLSGAGVKGKVIEGFKNGIPIVSTSIGLEGIKGVDSLLMAYDNPQEFAHRIDEIIAMPDIQWLSLSKKMQTFYTANYSYSAGWQALSKGLNSIGLI